MTDLHGNEPLVFDYATYSAHYSEQRVINQLENQAAGVS